ncbi:UNVERIFIED_ORG: broad specificity phosphatase PhoE [Burkholderia sp. 1263]|jgi:broad specificity phosphatase PhoE|uniref:Broad specificity phosphatase PhoE n=1 Tax=Paraburkholderia terricola TaxID=169427 RepID=A0A1M6WTZ5_9BURK|nr:MULTISPECIES: histidine phosphatase family protein [Paraburkholderia]AXE95542.1 histidine phosphatase family protein [Paraburkholderia terricola]ORC51955.1 histidine phosphatase family protein [Burkholderia sp. A27]SDP22165.1 Broad specificity phosphatase PhoE [Paraburkholderia sediminicola]SHK97111.1 Broad specificity phosphatase PhoE [Paraburkholderia terricola]
MDTRLLLVSHASTPAMRAGRFPADDPLDARGLAEAQAARQRLAIADAAAVFVSPAVCARDTALALGLAATVHTALAEIDYGDWQGRRLADLANEAPQHLAAWLRDPDFAAHGGESFSQLVKRLGEWLDALDGAISEGTTGTTSAPRQNPRNVVAITHAPVIRAALVHALGASPAVFPRIEIAPLSAVELRRSSRGWTWWPASH